MRKTLNKSVYLGLSILDLSVMYDFLHAYVKPKYGEKAKPCYMDKGSFLVYVKANDVYKDIAENVETRFELDKFWIRQTII